ncbi:MAG: large subunit ribosomal protein L24 [Parcubacteria group bacterium Gr01-1014_3]|nr:MAG: large subunit ribosomal protein L24 [Parcubacteria group bacterium Gr01-1014_3]
MKIHKGDTVQVMVGKDRGKNGKVLNVDTAESRVLVDGLNMVKKHMRPKKQGEKGEIVSLPRPLNASKVMLVCPSCKEPVRVGFQIDATAKRRICRSCKAII